MCSSVGVGQLTLEEYRKFVVYLLPFQISIIHYAVQDEKCFVYLLSFHRAVQHCRGEVASCGGG